MIWGYKKVYYFSDGHPGWAAAGGGERSLKPEDLASAAEAFVTNCLGIRAVVSVDGAPIGDGRPGPVFEKFRAIP